MSKHYGHTPVGITGKDTWDAHDHAQHWSDGGKVRELMQEVSASIEQVIAANAAEAVADYAGSAEIALSVSEAGELMVGVRMYNADANLVVHAPLRAIILAAISEIRPIVGADAQAQSFVSALVTLGNQLSRLAAPPAQAPIGHNSGAPAPVVPRQPTRPARKPAPQ